MRIFCSILSPYFRHALCVCVVRARIDPIYGRFIWLCVNGLCKLLQISQLNSFVIGAVETAPREEASDEKRAIKRHTQKCVVWLASIFDENFMNAF